jgi:hypothetical protein
LRATSNCLPKEDRWHDGERLLEPSRSATRVTASNEEEGFADAIERYVL